MTFNALPNIQLVLRLVDCALPMDDTMAHV